MTVTEAAQVWVAYRRKLAALGPEPKEASKVLKEYFRRTGKHAWKGVGYAFSTYPGLDLDKVRAELDPKALKRCEVTRERETLTLLDPRPPAAKAKAAKAG
jgi:hypothetical protein